MPVGFHDLWWIVVLLLVGIGVARLRARRSSPRAAPPAPPARAPEVATEAVDCEPVASPAAPAIVLRRPAPTRHPIVFVHGYFGFDAIGVSRMRHEYFRGVRGPLEALGHRVHFARVAPAAGVALRAAQLAQLIERLGAERVNIIAHSMGGLDARYAIARLGLHERVASLTTIGTPHRGTPLADTTALFLGDWTRARRVLDRLGANIDGLYDLTTRKMEEFNRAVLDAPDVTYSSIIGAARSGVTPVHTLLSPGHAYLLKAVGRNDGLVPAESQRWGQVLEEVDADHWAQIGWSRGFDAQTFYAMLAERLSSMGL